MLIALLETTALDRRPALLCLLLLLVLGAMFAVAFAPLARMPTAAPDSPLEINQTFGRLPLTFEANQGQSDPQVRFLARGGGYTLFLTPQEAGLSLWNAETDVATALNLRFVGANPNPTIAGEGAMPGKVNYLLGQPSQWHTGINTYAGVRYQALYPGIDLRFHGDRQQLEYDFIVAPGAEPAQIRLRFEGADALRLDGDGNLIVETAAGFVVQQAPIIYQEQGGRREPVGGRYDLSGGSDVRFEIDGYDRQRALIIDPVVYSTFLGGSGFDSGYGIAVDGSGAAYVTGWLGNDGDGFPYIPGGYQAPDPGGFVVKFNPAGNALVYTAFIEGVGYDIALDAQGNAHVAGDYHACLFCPARGFALKLSADGSSRLYFRAPLGYQANGIAVDNAGNAYVTGGTEGGDFIPTPGVFQPQYGGGNSDAFIARLNSSGNTVYASFLGGSTNDFADDVAIDNSGHAYITGGTASPDFPVANPFQPNGAGGNDAFLTKVSPDGSSLVYSTYFGGSDRDHGYSVALDEQNRPHLTGFTDSWMDFPLKNPYQSEGQMPEAFISKFQSDGSDLVYSTFLGGGDTFSAIDVGQGIAIDPDGNAVIIGTSDTPNYPVTANAPQGYLTGEFDVIVSKMSSDGQTLLFSTYLGGVLDDEGWAVAVDANGAFYLTGNTGSYEFPTVDPFQETIGITSGFTVDAFVTKIDEAALPKPLVDLTLEVEADPVAVHGGEPIEFTYTIENGGPDTATNTELIARMDSFSTFVAITPSQGSCSEVLANAVFECELGAIPSGASATVILDVLAPDVTTGSAVVDGFTYSNELDTDNLTNNNWTWVAVGDEIYQLTVSVSGAGHVISTNAPGIDCPPDCEHIYVPQGIELLAIPAPGAVFLGWGGDCSGGGSTCTVSMTQDRTVSATFSGPTEPTLTPTPTQAPATPTATGAPATATSTSTPPTSTPPAVTPTATPLPDYNIHVYLPLVRN